MFITVLMWRLEDSLSVSPTFPSSESLSLVVHHCIQKLRFSCLHFPSHSKALELQMCAPINGLPGFIEFKIWFQALSPLSHLPTQDNYIQCIYNYSM